MSRRCMDKPGLLVAIRNSGGQQYALDEADVLWTRIEYLQRTKRYGPLISQFARTNEKSNFLALVLEINFAHQFESNGLELRYEVHQDAKHNSSIDFLRTAPTGDSVFFELRLLQKAQAVTDSINKQLESGPTYSVAMDGEDEQVEIARIQNTILSKVQDKNGKPIKFFSTDSNTVNLVVVDATTSILDGIDLNDCKLAIYGDPSVDELSRRSIFGLFQDAKAEYPQRIHDLAARYAHIKGRLHGVLFLFKERGSGVLAYRLNQYLMWNPALINPAGIGEARTRRIFTEIKSAIPARRD
jgi:hypothetical protein